MNLFRQCVLAPLFCIGLLFLTPLGLSAQPSVLSSTVSLLVVGDMMLAGAPGKAMQRGQDPFSGFAKLFQESDIRIGNLECVVATKGSEEPDKPNTFRAHPRSLKYLRKYFDAVGLANNHSGDFGPEAFSEMLGLLKKNGIGYYGAGYNLKEAHTPLVFERNGIRIALLGYDEFQPRNFEADHDRVGVAWSEDEQVVRDIQAARKEWRADIVIPVMHWGWEEPIANARQRQLARLMIDAGADAVIGGHPHQVQDTERYKNKPIFYSLGNFVFDGFSLPENNRAWALRMELDKSGVRKWQVHTATINAKGIPSPTKQVAHFDNTMIQSFAPTGKLRAGINVGNPILAKLDAATQQPVGVSVDLATELAKRLGVPVEFVVFDAAGKSVEALSTEKVDIGFFAVDPMRADAIAFTAPYVLIEGSYLVHKNSPLQRNEEVDRPEHSIVVGKGSAYDLFLTREIKQAKLVRSPTSPTVVDMFVAEKHDVAAGVKQQLESDAKRLPNLRLLPGNFMVISQAMGVPKKRGADAEKFLRNFVEDMKTSGFVQKALERHKIEGASIAPPSR
jgi:ABC-type amino acid transport substrate-binding protein